ncbi:MAG: GtrA family protein [Clostridia bacterium]|nr:GtrA family protein [Clostridia bacterium]
MEEETKEGSVKQTKKQLFWEIFRFLLVGGTATVIDYLTSYLFYTWLLPPELIGSVLSLILSTALGFCVGLTVNWFLSVYFVFRAVKNREEANSKKGFVTFTLVGLVGLAVSVLGMQLVNVLPSITLFSSTTFLMEEWKWWLMKCVMTCIVLVWNYVGRKLLVFKS